MLRRTHFFLLGLFLLLLTAFGPDLYPKYELWRAHKLESDGKFKEAISLYTKILAHFPGEQNRDRSIVYLHLGDCWLHLGSPGEAFSFYEKSVSADTANMSAHLRLGTMYLAGGVPQRATQQAQAVLAAKSTSSDGLTLLGAASSAVGDTSLAEQAFENVLKQEPGRVNVAVALADVYSQQDEPEKARSVLRRTVELNPRNSLPWLSLGRLEEKEGNIGAAEESYRAAVAAEDSVETNTRLATFLARTSRPAEAQAVLTHADSINEQLPVGEADFKLLSGDPKAALEKYVEVLNSSFFGNSSGKEALISSLVPGAPKSKASTTQIVGRVVETNLELAANSPNTDPAAVLATSSASFHLSQRLQDIDSATAQILNAEIALIQKDASKAAQHAQKAIEFSPESAPAHYIRGLVFYDNGDESAGRAEWAEAISNDNTYAPARLVLAEDALQNHHYLQAEQYIVPVVRDEPENVRALKLFSSALLAQKKYGSSGLIARRAMRLKPQDSETHVILAKIAEGQAQVSGALEEYEKALSINSHSEEAMDGLVRLYSHGHITKEMLSKLEHVAEAPPASAPLMELAARLYAQRGWSGSAERCLRKAIQIDSHRVTAIEQLTRLKADRGEELSVLSLITKKGSAEAALLRGSQAETEGDSSAAIKEYESAVRQGESSGTAANNLAWLLAKNDHDLDRALMMAEQAQSVAQFNPAVWDTLGFVYLKRREYSAAIRVLQNAVQLSRRSGNGADQAMIEKHLREAYSRSGQPLPTH